MSTVNPRLSRRLALDRLTRSAAALALGSLFALPDARRGAQAASARPILSDLPFSLGVASGMPRPDSVVLWTRLAPQPLAPGGGMPPVPVVLRWELAEDAHFSRGLRRGELLALPDNAHAVHLEVSGLRSASGYFYRFMLGDAVSPVGRTRTAPALDAPVQRLRLALASCQHYEQGAFAAHREIASRDLDLVLFVGDYIYESSNPRYLVRPHEALLPLTLDDYRARHATYKLDADLRAAHAAHPWVVTWDDHDVQNDYAGDVSGYDRDPAVFLARRVAAYKAYFEHLPISPAMAPVNGHLRIHDRYAWGQLADLWTLDNRQYRDRQACSPPGRGGGRVIGECAALADPARSMFGHPQEAWLAQGLTTSARQWKLLGQATQISASGVDTPLGHRIYSDGWDGYPLARERLLGTIGQAGLRNVIALGGDVHRHVAAQLRVRPHDAASPIVASEFVASSVTTHGVSELATLLMQRDNPDLLHMRSDERGYALVEITPEAARCDFRATPFPAQADAPLVSQARVVVEAGQAGVKYGG